MNRWGERFVELDSFLSYCRDLRVDTDRLELEYYEKIGAMFPVAKVVYPAEYIIQIHRSNGNSPSADDATDCWPVLDRLSEKFRISPDDYGDLTDQELIHCFDREMADGGNPHLIRPDSVAFQPWCDYRVAVFEDNRHEIKRPTAEHYYSYWQVHQLYYIQRYPDLYKNARLIELAQKYDPIDGYRPWAPKKEALVNFRGMRSMFDALSFWIVVEQREHDRTFANVPTVHGIRRLNDGQADAYRNKLACHARMVTDRFGIDRQELFGFLSCLIDIYDDYERRERQRLKTELKNDIFAWEELVAQETGATRDTIAHELGKLRPYHKETFLHLDIVAKERDRALRLLNNVSAKCSEALGKLGNQTWSFEASEADALIEYCNDEGLGLLPTALSGMVAIGEEESRQKFRRVQKYTNLKNVLTSYEYFLKSLVPRSVETLTPLVSRVMSEEAWSDLFDARKYLLKGANAQELLANLAMLLEDSELRTSVEGFWARKFLITCLARNMSVHSYPSEDSYYGDLFGPMLDAVVSATFYTWRLGKAKGYI